MKNKKALLVCDESLAAELSPNLNAEVIRRGDPYQAMLAVKDSKCDLMIVTSLTKKLESLCQAAKRINANLKICVISSVADEPSIIKMDANAIDEYFIYPPTEAELLSL